MLSNCTVLCLTQSCPTLCDPVDCSPPGSSVHGILQARTLEWGAISFSRASSWSRDRTQVSRIAGGRFNLWATRACIILNLVFSGYVPRSGPAELYGSSVFSFLRDRHPVLYCGYTSFHSHQQCRLVLFPPHHFWHLLFVDFSRGPFWQVEVIPHC